jgi:hypothetical protein
MQWRVAEMRGSMKKLICKRLKMLIEKVFSDLDRALGYASLRTGEDVVHLHNLLDDIRDRSYAILPKQTAFFIRTACSEIEHVAQALDPKVAILTAEDAIARVRTVGITGSHDLNAA